MPQVITQSQHGPDITDQASTCKLCSMYMCAHMTCVSYNVSAPFVLLTIVHFFMTEHSCVYNAGWLADRSCSLEHF